ncbi:hypothetical protein [Phreatobacter stygius]|uniref:Uncharacterized protein n=1 Tax=Phreatobacter stygius TaxID=1940610 RepID=A0A4D7ATW3_9HYPH|nr:hypothetical protein [Phreatobacter stygius]QCI64339.1 hypothetical protein E8M01_08910 [Phreatobacter stygius]
MTETTSVTDDIKRSTHTVEIETLRSITSGIASFGAAVRGSPLSNAQKSRVLASLAEASSNMLVATSAYMAELGASRGRAATLSTAE